MYTTVDLVQAALGPSVVFTGDPYAQQCVDAANDVITNKRAAAGYLDTTPAPPGPVQGATLYAVALWRERQSTDSFQSFDDFQTAVQTGGAWPQIKRLCGIPKAAVDAVPTPQQLARFRHPAGIYR